MIECRITHWDGAGVPTEIAIKEILRLEGLVAHPWSNAGSAIYNVHTHSFDKVIYVIHGSITFILPDTGETILAQVGDRLDLPRGTSHAARVGPDGVSCLEAHK
jgi:mannose-6-phosphate isomerase-like protein (cupin superfamily)